MRKLKRKGKDSLSAKSCFIVITPDLLLGLGIGAMFEHMQDFTFVGHARSLPDGAAMVESRGHTGVIVDFRQLPSTDVWHPLEGFTGNSREPGPVVVFVPSGSGCEATWVCHRYCVVTSSDPLEEWHAALRAACRGGRHLSPLVARLLAETASLPPAIHGHGKSLSPREQEVLALTRAGWMPRQIASRLGRSVKTVEAHYARIKMKLGVERIEMLRQPQAAQGMA